LHKIFGAKISNPKARFVIFGAKILYKKHARKTLMKLTQGLYLIASRRLLSLLIFVEK